MSFRQENNLTLVISSLSAGGAEKVMAQLADIAANKFTVTLIVLTKRVRFYLIEPCVEVREPHFAIEGMSRLFLR